MANIVDKYFSKKKKQIYEYCKNINKFLEYDTNQIWKTESELNEYIKSTISSYVDKFYFKSMEEFEEYSEYLGSLIKCDNRFKTILVCGVNSISNELKIGNYKVSAYIISLVVYTGVIIDRFTYPYNHYRITVNNVKAIVEPMFNSVSFVNFKYDSDNMKKLVSLIKKNDNLETRFYEGLNLLNTDLSKNNYECVDTEKKYYKIIYKYKIPGLEDYRSKDVSKYMKRISDDLNCISYELSTLTALKSRMLKKDITLLFPVNLEFYEKQSEVNKLFKVLNNNSIKDIIKFYINYDDYRKHTSLIRILSNAEFTMALNFESDREVPYGTFNEIKVALINKEFLEINKGNVDSWKNSGVKFVIKSINESVSELVMLGLEE